MTYKIIGVVNEFMKHAPAWKPPALKEGGLRDKGRL
jgi:hypothetical protein